MFNILTFSFHANPETLFHPAVLATVSVAFIHRATPSHSASVIEPLLDATFEKQLATFASVRSVMSPG